MESPFATPALTRRRLVTRIGLPAIALMMALPADGRGTTSIYIIPCLQVHENVADLPIVVLQAPGDAVSSADHAFGSYAPDVSCASIPDVDSSQSERLRVVRISRIGGRYGP